MNETDWLTCTQPRLILRFLRRNKGEPILLQSWFTIIQADQLSQKWRLFLAKYCDRIAPLLSKRSQRLIEFASSFIERVPSVAERERIEGWFGDRPGIQSIRLIRGLYWPLSSAAGQLRQIAGHCAFRSALTRSAADREELATQAMRAAMHAEAAVQCNLIREIIGNPFK